MWIVMPPHGPSARVFRSLYLLPTRAPQPLRFLPDCFELTELN